MLNHIFRVSAGAVLVVVGIAGIFLPIVPGILLIFLGIALILDRNPKVLFNEIVVKVKNELHNRAKK